MKGKSKMQDCMSPHLLMHVLLGLGLGITLVTFIPALAVLWVGLALIVAAWGLDYMRR